MSSPMIMFGEYQVPEAVLDACFLVSGDPAFCFKRLIAYTWDAEEYVGKNLTGKRGPYSRNVAATQATKRIDVDKLHAFLSKFAFMVMLIVLNLPCICTLSDGFLDAWYKRKGIQASMDARLSDVSRIRESFRRALNRGHITSLSPKFKQ